ncbi:MAG TPA: PEGA domain-containing protein [Terracidiphilus sp.]|nr:PEGA domain-containing protein [Terracidiphilus sp.]
MDLRYFLFTFVLALLLSASAAAQMQVVLWPDADHPVLRFTFDQFRGLVGSVGSQRPYAIDTTAQNLSDKQIGSEQFVVDVFDDKHIRIADGSMDVTNLGPGQSVKFQIKIMATGIPASLRIMSQAESQKPITLTVNSSPQGALLKLDGVDAGTTPALIEVAPGKHQLTFGKDGFKVGLFSLEIGKNDVSGGAINFELGKVQFDTIELRDGTVLSGDLDSIQGMDVVVRIGGTLQRIDRNKVKRIILIEREPLTPSDLPPVQTKQ